MNCEDIEKEVNEIVKVVNRMSTALLIESTILAVWVLMEAIKLIG